jgi:hypothetical protein
MKRCVTVWLGGLLLLGIAAPVLAETVLEKIKRTGVLTAGTLGMSIPFAFITTMKALTSRCASTQPFGLCLIARSTLRLFGPTPAA